MVASVLSPYITSHPEYSSLLGQKVDFRDFWGREYARLTIFHSKDVVYASPWVELSWLVTLEDSFQLPFDRRRLRACLDYSRISRGFIFTRRIWLRLPRLGKIIKPGRVPISVFRPEYPRAVRFGRSWTKGVVKSPLARPVFVPRSTTLRPNPENISTPFLDVFETTTRTGSYERTDTVTSKLIKSRSWTGSRTPGFGKLKSKALPVNPHSVLIKEIGANISVATAFTISNPSAYSAWTRLYTRTYPDPGGTPGHLPLAANNALRKLIDKAQLGIDANLAQDFAQIGQTFSLIAGNATKIFRALVSLKRGNIPQAIHFLTAGHKPSLMPKGRPSISKSLASNWLELQYGWKPLLQDIEGTLKSLSVLNASATTFVQRVVASGKAVAYAESSFDPLVVSGQNLGTGKNIFHTTTTARYTLRYKIADPLKSFLAQTGFTNPVNLIWEILPFSFVVDWFLPIGPYLEAFSAFDGLVFLDGSLTQFTKNRTVSAVDNEQVSRLNNTSFVIEHSRYLVDWVKLDRTKLTAFPTPTFPQFKNGLASVTHAANAIALLKSVFSH